MKTTVSQSTLYSVFCAFIWLIVFSVEEGNAARPFWTNTPSYVEGHYLYVLGSVRNMPSLEVGKQQALVHGKLQLMNVAQVSEVGTDDLALEARHTYVENNPNGTVNVYQLFRIPAAKVLEAQAKLQTQQKTQQRALTQSQQELTTLQDSLRNKQQTVTAQLATVEEKLKEITSTQERFTIQSEAIDKQQLAIERLQATLKGKFAAIDKDIQQMDKFLKELQTKSQAQDDIIDRLKGIEESLEEKEVHVRLLHQAIVTRLEEHATLACKYVKPGMTPQQVKKLLGDPSGEKLPFLDERYDIWAYGRAKINFDSQGMVKSVTGCDDQKAN